MSIEEVRELYRAQLNQSRELLGKLIDEVEASFIFLALTDRQEKMVTEIMQRNVAPVLKLFEDTVEMEQKFGEIIDSLQSQKQDGAADVWLF